MLQLLTGKVRKGDEKEYSVPQEFKKCRQIGHQKCSKQCHKMNDADNKGHGRFPGEEKFLGLAGTS